MQSKWIRFFDEGNRVKDLVFREYDIRGTVGTDLLIEEVYDFARALAYYFAQKGHNVQCIVVGMDGRVHSQAIRQELCRGLTDSGIDVILMDVCPSPALYFALHEQPVDAGIMITASHNPKGDNGFKINLAHGAVWGDELRVIRDLFKARKHLVVERRGTIKSQEILALYIDWLVEHFKHLKGSAVSALVDCGNGTASTVLQPLVERMEWQHVQLLYPEVDGTYPNHEADPTVESNLTTLKQLLATTSAQLGIGLDGDCDRMVAMTKSGELILGDKLLALFAQEIVREHPGTTIIFDIKSSSGLIELLEQWGAKPGVTATGHNNIKEQMREQHALLGGELSCHFFFKDRYFGYDDGIYAMCRLFELLEREGKPLDALLGIFPHKCSSREYRIACPEDKKSVIIERVKNIFAQRADVAIMTLDGVRVATDRAWGLLRASNTQPVVSLRFEGNTLQDLHDIKEQFINALSADFDVAALREQFNS